MDGWILERTKDTKSAAVKALRWVIDLPVFKREYTGPAIASLGVVALFFFLTVPSRETGRFSFVAMELAALAALVALGLYAASRYGDRFAALAAALRIFAGFKLLHEIWARTAPGVNALPGFAGAEAQTEVWQQVVDNHWGLFIALDGGRIMSLDSLRRPALAARFGLPIPPVAIPALIVLAAVNAIAATVVSFNLGITPDAYVDSMPAMVTAFVAIFSGLLAFTGWLQRHTSLDHSGEMLHIRDRTPADPELV
jgi:hypothetical protein